MSLGFLYVRALRNFTLSHNPNLCVNSVGLSLTQGRSFCVAAEAESGRNENGFTKDRSMVIPVETSIRYMKSEAYLTTYGTDPVWKHFRRNFVGHKPAKRTRKTCIRGHKISTGSPCPICRDEYLVLHPLNVDLLKQFISPYNGEVLPVITTNICMKQYENLLIAIIQAREKGLLTFQVPYR